MYRSARDLFSVIDCPMCRGDISAWFDDILKPPYLLAKKEAKLLHTAILADMVASQKALEKYGMMQDGVVKVIIVFTTKNLNPHRKRHVLYVFFYNKFSFYFFVFCFVIMSSGLSQILWIVSGEGVTQKRRASGSPVNTNYSLFPHELMYNTSKTSTSNLPSHVSMERSLRIARQRCRCGWSRNIPSPSTQTAIVYFLEVRFFLSNNKQKKTILHIFKFGVEVVCLVFLLVL